MKRACQIHLAIWGVVLIFCGEARSRDELGLPEWLAGDTVPILSNSRYCAAYCAYHILALNGSPADYAEVLQSLPPEENGVRLTHMIQYLKEKGLKAKYLKASPEDLEKIVSPFIVVQPRSKGKGSHFFVAVPFSDGARVMCLDGSKTEVVFKRSVLIDAVVEERWSGDIVVVGADAKNAHRRRMLQAGTGFSLLLGGLAVVAANVVKAR